MSGEAFISIFRYGGMPCAMFVSETIESALRCITEERPDEVFIDYHFSEKRDGANHIGGASAYLALREAIGNTPARVMHAHWNLDEHEDQLHSFHIQGIPYGQYNELVPAK